MLATAKPLIRRLVNRSGYELVRAPVFDRRRAGYANFGEEGVIRRLLSLCHLQNRFCVDIGAGDGVTMSNALGLLRAGWAGACIEGDGVRFAQLAVLHQRNDSVRLARTIVTPDNVVETLIALGAPTVPDFLSLDIDGYDYYVLDALLARFRPMLLCTEINEKIPPSLRFSVLYRPGYWWGGNDFFGYGIAMLTDLCQKHGYAIACLEYNNAFLMPAELIPVPPLDARTAYLQGYWERPDRLVKLPWNQSWDILGGLPAEQAMQIVRERFSSFDGSYLLEPAEPEPARRSTDASD